MKFEKIKLNGLMSTCQPSSPNKRQTPRDLQKRPVLRHMDAPPWTQTDARGLPKTEPDPSGSGVIQLDFS